MATGGRRDSMAFDSMGNIVAGEGRLPQTELAPTASGFIDLDCIALWYQGLDESPRQDDAKR